jgi:hypothetical protein
MTCPSQSPKPTNEAYAAAWDRAPTTRFADTSRICPDCVSAKALSTFMGHTAISITLDLYGHLMPGSEAEAAALLDKCVTATGETADERARGAGAGLTGAQLGREAHKPLV